MSDNILKYPPLLPFLYPGDVRRIIEALDFVPTGPDVVGQIVSHIVDLKKQHAAATKTAPKRTTTFGILGGR